MGSCTYSYGALTHTAATTASNITPGFSGSATATCTAGAVSLSGATCAAGCAAVPSYTPTSSNCSYPIPALASGASITVGDSTAGYTGNITLTNSDVGLGSVDNTSDATKNAATATLTNKTISGGVLSGATVLPQAGSVTIYNTTDQVTNFERAAAFWTGNAFYLTSTAGGTGTRRAMILENGGGSITVNPSSNLSGGVSIRYDTGSPSVTGVGILGTLGASSGVQYSTTISPTFTQTGTAGYTALLINPTETSTGSGAKKLLDAQVGGVSRFQVDSAGNVTAGNTTSTTTASPLRLSLGGTYGTNAAGSPDNLKLLVYDDGSSARYGIGAAASAMEYQVPYADNVHRFFVAGGERLTIGATSAAMGQGNSGGTTTPFALELGTSYGTNTAGTAGNLKLRHDNAGDVRLARLDREAARRAHVAGA